MSQFVEDCFIVINNDGFYVFGAAMANFGVIYIKNTVKFKIFWAYLKV